MALCPHWHALTKHAKTLLKTAILGANATHTFSQQAVHGALAAQVLNPATEEAIATCSKAGASETTKAISSAEAAWPAWRAKTAKERSNILKSWYTAMVENEEDIIKIMVMECGKPVKEAKGEFAAGIASVEWFAEEAKR